MNRKCYAFHTVDGKATLTLPSGKTFVYPDGEEFKRCYPGVSARDIIELVLKNTGEMTAKRVIWATLLYAMSENRNEFDMIMNSKNQAILDMLHDMAQVHGRLDIEFSFDDVSPRIGFAGDQTKCCKHTAIFINEMGNIIAKLGVTDTGICIYTQREHDPVGYTCYAEIPHNSLCLYELGRDAYNHIVMFELYRCGIVIGDNVHSNKVNILKSGADVTVRCYADLCRITV